MSQFLECPSCSHKDDARRFVTAKERQMPSVRRIERNATITKMVNNGFSYGDVACEFGLSRQRVEQICKIAGVRSKYYVRGKK